MLYDTKNDILISCHDIVYKIFRCVNMNNRTSLLFAFSLMTLSCSAMEIDSEDGRFLDFLSQATCSNVYKQEFIHVTDRTLET